MERDGVLTIHIRAGMPPLTRPSVMLGGVLLLTVAATGVGIFVQSLDNPAPPPMWLIGTCGTIGLAAMIGAILASIVLVLPSAVSLRLELSANRVLLDDRGRLDLPRMDVRSVAILRARKQDWRLRARRHSPWARNDAGGIAIDTPNGMIQVARDFWHESVTVWVASLLAAWADVALIGEEPDDRPLPQRGAAGQFPQRVPRKELVSIGVCASSISVLFLWLGWPTVRDSFAAARWRPVPGIIWSIDQNRRSRQLQITYSYEVDGQGYTSDRYSLAGGYSGVREAEKRRLQIAQPVEVWVDPADPRRSAIDKRFATADFVMWLFFGAFGPGGIGCLVFALFKHDTPMAVKYDAGPAPIR